MPVSRTATSTPWPVLPRDHTSPAPIWAVLSARAAFALPSSQTFFTPLPLPTPPARLPALPRAAAPDRPAVIDDRNAPEWSTLSAAPPMLASGRIPVAPAGADRAAAAV